MEQATRGENRCDVGWLIVDVALCDEVEDLGWQTSQLEPLCWSLGVHHIGTDVCIYEQRCSGKEPSGKEEAGSSSTQHLRSILRLIANWGSRLMMVLLSLNHVDQEARV